MKVLCLIDSLAPGGAESSLAAMASHYPDRGIELEVAYLRERPGLHERFEAVGTPLFSLADSSGRIGWARAVRRLINGRRPDLVHTTLFESDVAGRLGALGTRVPVVSSLVNVEYGPEQFADPRLSAWKLRGAQVVDAVTARSVVRWHAITDHVATVMARRLRIDRRRIDVVPRGRDPEVLGMRTPERRRLVRRSLGVGRNTKLVLAAARQEHQKGLDILVRAMPAVTRNDRRVRLLIAGRAGHQSESLRSLVDVLEVHENVQFLGARSDVPDLLAAADVFAFPSRFEGLGSVLIEAMALEAPIVASNLPAVGEIVDDGRHALLVPPERPDALAAALNATLADPDSAAARARAARERFLVRYTIAAVADGMAAFYSHALGASPQDCSQNGPRSESHHV